MTILTIFLFSLAFVSNTLALPLQGEFEEITIPADSSSFDIDFFFEKTGNPQGGIILTHAEPNSQLANNLAHVLSHYGWAVAIIDLADQFILPRRTRFPQKPIQKQDSGEEMEIDPYPAGNITSTEETELDPNPAGDITSAEDKQLDPNPIDDITPAEDERIEANPPNDITTAEDKQIESNPPNDITEAKPVPSLDTISPEKKLSAIINFMESERGLLNLVFLSISESFDHLNQYILTNSGQLQNVQALILLDVSQTNAINKLPKALAILDIDTNRIPSAGFSARKISSRRFRLTHYYQVHLPFVLQQQEFGEDRLTKRIRGWLAVYIKGMEIRKR